MADYSIKALLEIIFKGRGAAKEAADATEQVARGAKAAKKDMADAAESTTLWGRAGAAAAKQLAALGAAMAGVFAAGKLLQFVGQAVKDFAVFQRALGATRLQMQNMGLDADAAIPRVRAFAEAIALSGGPLAAETIPAFQKFIGLTRDTEAALAAVELAANISESGLLGMQQAVEAVSNIMAGRAQGAARALGLEARDLNGHLLTNGQLMQKAIDQYAGLGDKLSDAQNQLDQVAGSWERTKFAIGELVAGALPAVVPVVSSVIGHLGLAAIKAVGLFQQLGALVVGTTRQLLAAGDMVTLVKEGPDAYVKAIVAANAEAGQAVFENMKATQERMAKFLLSTTQAAAGVTAAGQAALVDAANKSAQEKADKDADKAAERAEKAAEKRAAAVLDVEQEYLRARLEQAKQGTQERLDAEIEILAFGRRKALAQVEGDAAAQATIERTFEMAQQTAIAAYWDERTATQQAALDKQTDALIEYYTRAIELEREAQAELAAARMEQLELDADDPEADPREAARAQQELLAARQAAEIEAIQAFRETKMAEAALTAEAQVQLEEATRLRIENVNRKYDQQRLRAERAQGLARSDFANQVAQDVVADLRLAFGDSKAVMIAQAIVDTWASVNRTLAFYGYTPLGYTMAALAAAAGLANVAKMRSAQPGTGGGGGGAGYGGGAASAGQATAPRYTTGAKVVPPSSSGSGQQAQGGAGGSVTNNWTSKGGDTIINAGVVVADQATLVELGRKLDRAGRMDKARMAR